MLKQFFLAIGLAAIATVAMSQSAEERKVQIQEKEHKDPSKEAADRKERSTKQLQHEGVPIIAHLPVIEDSTEAKVRKTEDVAHRAIAICIAALKGEGLEQGTVDTLVTKFGALKFFSPDEAAFIKDASPSQPDLIKFSWRYEGLWVTLWTLGYVEKLDRPENICDVAKAVSFFRDRDTAQFIKDAKLRTIKELLDQADLIYRYDWAVTNARVKNQPVPAKLEGGVVHERHYILNWLIGYLNQDWDDVSTDT